MANQYAQDDTSTWVEKTSQGSTHGQRDTGIDDCQEKENFLPTVMKSFMGMLLRDQIISSEDCQPFQERLPPQAGGPKFGSPEPM